MSAAECGLKIAFVNVKNHDPAWRAPRTITSSPAALDVLVVHALYSATSDPLAAAGMIRIAVFFHHTDLALANHIVRRLIDRPCSDT